MYLAGTMNDYLQERLGDLCISSIVAKFQALNPTLWPPYGPTRETNEAFASHGEQEVMDLWEHYGGLLETHGATKDDLIAECRQFKAWARKQETSPMETVLAVLK